MALRRPLQLTFSVFISVSFATAQLLTTSGTASPENIALGGILTSAFTSHPLAIAENPSLIGAKTWRHSMSVSVLVPPVKDLYAIPDHQRSETAFFLSADLADFLPRIHNVNVGIGYSRRVIDIPDTRDDRGGPDFLEGSPGTTDRLHIGFGYTDVWSARAGASVKWIYDPSIYYPDPSERKIIHSYDIAVGTLLPLIPLLADSTLLFGMLRPDIDLSIGAAWGDLGNEVRSFFGASEPTERRVNLGAGIRFRISLDQRNDPWELVTLTILREAEDDLLRRNPRKDSLSDPVTDQLGWMGQIQPFRHLIMGDTYGDAIVRKGWELGMLELFYFRGGSESAWRIHTQRASGFGIRSTGLFRIITLLAGPGRVPVLDFFQKHLEVRYDETVITPRRICSSLGIRAGF